MSRLPHQVLGIAADATEKQVRRAFRQLARRYHPDRNPAPEATARFLAAKEAHDEMMRALRGEAPPRRRRPPPRRPPPSPPPPRAPEPEPPPDPARRGGSPRGEPVADDTVPGPEWPEEIALEDVARPLLYAFAAAMFVFTFWLFTAGVQGLAGAVGGRTVPPAAAPGSPGTPGSPGSPGR